MTTPWPRPALFLLLLLAESPRASAAIGQDVETVEPERPFSLIPFGGISVSGMELETVQAFGVRFLVETRGRVGADGWAQGHWVGTEGRGEALAGDLIWERGGKARGTGVSVPTGLTRWEDRMAVTLGIRARGGMSADGHRERAGEGAEIPPIHVWLDVRGGLCGSDSPAGGGKGGGIASLSLTLPMQLGGS